MTRPSPAARFWSKVDRSPHPLGCWLWTGARQRHTKTKRLRYGFFLFEGRQQMAHRVAFALEHGPIPEGVLILHSCDNPPCVNPAHLFQGTHKGNMGDMAAKGRAYGGDRHWTRSRPLRGEAHGRAKLTAAQVVEIRASGDTHAALAVRYNVSKPLIGRVRRGEIW